MKMNKFAACALMTLALLPGMAEAVNIVPATTPDNNAAVKQAQAQDTTGYVARNDNVQLLFDALSSRIHKPIVVSQKAQKKRVSGDFDMKDPMPLLNKLCQDLGLIWFNDGQSIYIYDSSEMKNTVMSLKNASLSMLTDFLRKTSLLDSRFPIKGQEELGTFYVSGPPVYVDIVVSAATYLDDLYRNVDLNKQRIQVIKLHNTFVLDRSYTLRGNTVNVPGIATVIQNILADDTPKNQTTVGGPKDPVPDAPAGAVLQRVRAAQGGGQPQQPQVKVIAYPDTNSLLVKGSYEQVRLIENLVSELDIPKQHIELSLWIIDLQKGNLDQLGVNWQAGAQKSIGGVTAGVSLNSDVSLSTLDGAKFLAQVKALSSKGEAQIVSRPIVLTQDNVPAMFDNNRTFYTKLVGDHNSSLDHVTYGTMISVLPRLTADNKEIEMSLNIEDGSTVNDGSTDAQVDGLPVVGDTKINTVARVPKDKSLLIGGYTRNENDHGTEKIPLLGDLPLVGGMFRMTKTNDSKTVRVFLIQPRVLDNGGEFDNSQFQQEVKLGKNLTVVNTVQALRAYMENHYGDQH